MSFEIKFFPVYITHVANIYFLKQRFVRLREQRLNQTDHQPLI